MTEITAKPFDWNDNLSEEAMEDFEVIRKDLSYCACQSIGMALAKLELLEKQGCKVIDSKSEWQHDHEILKAYSDGANAVLDKIRDEIEQIEINGHIRDVECFRAGINTALNVIDKYKAEGSEE